MKNREEFSFRNIIRRIVVDDNGKAPTYLYLYVESYLIQRYLTKFLKQIYITDAVITLMKK